MASSDDETAPPEPTEAEASPAPDEPSGPAADAPPSDAGEALDEGGAAVASDADAAAERSDVPGQAAESDSRGRSVPAEPPPKPRAMRAIVACAIAIVALLAADLATKRWAEGRLSTERLGDRPSVCDADENGTYRYQRLRRIPLVVVEDILELEYAENCGAAFGLLRSAPAMLRGAIFDTAAIVASLALLFLFVTGRGGPPFAWSVPFVVSGAVGNLFDRLYNGYVVDFIHFHYGSSFDYPTFNVADIAIAIGVALLVIDGFRTPRETAPPTAAPAAGPSPT